MLSLFSLLFTKDGLFSDGNKDFEGTLFILTPDILTGILISYPFMKRHYKLRVKIPLEELKKNLIERAAS